MLSYSDVTCYSLALFVNYSYGTGTSFSHIGVCSSLQDLMNSLVHRRGASLGLCVLIVQNA